MNTKLGKNTCVSCCLFLFSILFFAYQKQGVLEFQEIKQATGGLKKHLAAAALACDSAESGVDLRSKSLTPIAIGVDGWGCFWIIKFWKQREYDTPKNQMMGSFINIFLYESGTKFAVFCVGQIKKRGVTQLELSVFVFLHILDDTKHPKNPDPSYGNARPSIPGALKQVVLTPHDIPWNLRANWIPSIPFTQDFIRVYLVAGFNPFEKY